MQRAKITCGVPSLDRLLGGLRTGDNVVWHVESGVFMESFTGAFLKTSRRLSHKVVIVTVNSPPKGFLGGLRGLVDHPDVTIVDGFTWGKGGGAGLFIDLYQNLYARLRCRVVPVREPQNVDSFLKILNEVEEGMPPGTRYVFESLTGMIHLWGEEELVLGFFATQCPRLYELQTIAYWILEKGAHTSRFRAQVNHLTQVALEITLKEGNPRLSVLKALGREASSTLRPKWLRVQRGRIELVEEESLPSELLIGPRLREIRQSRGMSQMELARAIGVSASTISQVEGQQIMLSLPALVRIARALGVSLDELVRPGPHTRESPILSRDKRERVCLVHMSETGLEVFRITPPGAEGGLEVFEIKVKSGTKIKGHFFLDKRHELGYLIEGDLLVSFQNRVLHLERGDAIRLVREVPQAWENPGQVEARLLWILGG